MRPYKYMLAASALMLTATFAGCSDSDSWQPGPQDTSTGVSAYFEIPAKTAYIFGSDFDPEDMVINLEVERQITDTEASVGLTLTSETEGFTCPGSVTFAAGESTAVIPINCSGIPKGKIYEFTISLAEDQTDIYGPGLHNVTFSAIKADWVMLSPKVRYLYSNTSYKAMYPETYGELYQLEGTMRFKLTDFFGSGLDITYECTDPADAVLYPLQNADFDNVWDEDKEYSGWYLYDDANSTWPAWVPGGAEGYPAITYLLFYAHSDYTFCNMIYDESDLYGYISFTVGVNMDAGNFSWGYYQADFNLEYNPFEK